MIELGGGIYLDGFDGVEPGKLIVVKKVVGNYTKSISEKVKDFKKITVKYSENGKIKISVVVEADKEYSGEDEGDNLFFALDKALSKILEQI